MCWLWQAQAAGQASTDALRQQRMLTVCFLFRLTNSVASGTGTEAAHDLCCSSFQHAVTVLCLGVANPVQNEKRRLAMEFLQPDLLSAPSVQRATRCCKDLVRNTTRFLLTSAIIQNSQKQDTSCLQTSMQRLAPTSTSTGPPTSTRACDSSINAMSLATCASLLRTTLTATSQHTLTIPQ